MKQRRKFDSYLFAVVLIYNKIYKEQFTRTRVANMATGMFRKVLTVAFSIQIAYGHKHGSLERSLHAIRAH